MKPIKIISPMLLVLVLNGCATLPEGPSVNVLPAQGKPFDVFRDEDAACRQYAEERLGLPAQEVHDQHVASGAVAGTAIGAGVGALLGAASHNAGAGAVVGGASGLLIGTAAGASSGEVYGAEAQRRYDNAYVQCMYSYGNQVPGVRRVAAAPSRRSLAPPPPPPSMAVPPPDTPPPPEVSAEPGQYDAPDEFYVEEAPQFIYSPELRLYVAVGLPYDLVYNGTDYFYFHAGRWYRGPYYNGPWRPVARRYYPYALRRYPISRVRYYRDFEFRRYEHDRAHYDGRFHRPPLRERHRH